MGGGGFLAGLLAWIQGNVLTTLGTLGVIGIGIIMIAARAHPVTIIMVCAGIWIIFNADTLVAMLHT